MMTSSTFATLDRPAPRTQAGGRGNGGVIITARICNPEDDGEAGAVKVAEAIIRQHIETLLSVTEPCNVSTPSLPGLSLGEAGGAVWRM